MPPKPYVVPPAPHKPNPAVKIVEPAGKPVEALPRLAEDFAKRIRNALNAISVVSDTATRNVLDLYYNKITTHEKLISDGDSDFPRKPVFHPVNKERFILKNASRANLLIAHLGSAILGLYEVAMLQRALATKEGDIQAYTLKEVQHEHRVQLLEDIVRYGLSKFQVVGSESAGYTLLKPGVIVSPKPIINSDRKSDDVIEEDDDNVPLLSID